MSELDPFSAVPETLTDTVLPVEYASTPEAIDFWRAHARGVKDAETLFPNDPLAKLFLGREAIISTQNAEALTLDESVKRDPLTGLFNRRVIEPLYADLQAAKGNRHDEQNSLSSTHSLLLLDCDGFKGINDRYGHTKGDAQLQLVAGCLVKNIRKSDVVIRLGGDEFAIFLLKSTEENAVMVAEKIRADIAHYEGSLTTLSIGLTQLRLEDSYQKNADRADAALYGAKKYHDRVVTYSKVALRAA